jgi:hypothetical protein
MIMRMNSDLPIQHERAAFVIEKQLVFCEVETEFLSIINMNLRLHRVALIVLQFVKADSDISEGYKLPLK